MSEFKTTELNINVSSNFTDLFLCNCAFKKSLHITSSKQLLKVHFLLKMLGWSNDLKNLKLEFFPLHVRIVLWCQIIRIMILSATMLRQHIIESLNEEFFLLRCCDTTMVLRLLISLEQLSFFLNYKFFPNKMSRMFWFIKKISMQEGFLISNWRQYINKSFHFDTASKKLVSTMNWNTKTTAKKCP